MSKETIKNNFERQAKSCNEIGSILREAREKSGLTQLQVAVAMGFSEGAVRRMEKGAHNPNTDSVERYAKAVGLELTYNFTGYFN